ncbi:MAG: SpoIID/LytB domain-containing protein [Patescibacteria group bacterium]|nr:SpoIID/LytB domain-containing protein [Patescibacteria group bacterium]
MTQEKKSNWFSTIISVIIASFLIILIAFLLRFLEKTLIKEVEAKTLDYAARKIEQKPIEIIKLKAGKSITFEVKFKNVGQKNWLKGKVFLKSLASPKSSFTHPFWPQFNVPYIVKWGVPVGQTGTLRFALRAPETNGLYWEKFQLFVNQSQIPGGEIEIGINVYGGKNPSLPSTNQNSTPSGGIFWETISPNYQIQEEIKYQEPKIRVGLLYSEEESTQDEDLSHLPIKIKTLNQEPYEIRLIKEDYRLLLVQSQGEEIEIDFDFQNKRYLVKNQGQLFANTDSPLLFSPLFDTTIFKITSWQRGPFWGLPVNDNEYRGLLEIRFNPSTNRLWLINELPIEEYMKGVAEVQDYYPYEMLKAQKIAARTYAFFRFLFPKYTQVPDGEGPIFTVRATQADQVYRGYNWEKRSPNTQRAVEETRGMIMIYENQPILAYYFARSDGRTRSSCEARMTKECLPYLVSVPDPPGQGKTLKGHGVGMPQQGARIAAEQGALFHQILRYYYPGVEIKKVW